MATGPQPIVDFRREGDRGLRLDSWKEIASYLKRHVTTVRRWEKLEGLPVHRHLHSKLGSIYAYSNELETWLNRRQPDSTSPIVRAPPTTVPVERPLLPSPPALQLLDSSATSLVGRESELKAFDEVWCAVREGRCQLVVLSGEPGIGKTRLALEFARSSTPPATILFGRSDREALVPYAPFVEVLQWLLDVCPAPVLRAYLAEVDGGFELSQLVPKIAPRLRPPKKPPLATSEGRRYRMFEAFVQLLRQMSRDGPVLVVLDDMQWADPGSLLLLRHLVRSTREVPICVIVAYCETELREIPWSAEMLADLRREPAATSFTLHALSEEQIHRFISTWTEQRTAPELSRFAFGMTQGNPLFLTEMLRHLTEIGALPSARTSHGTTSLAESGIPESIRELVGHRVSRLGGACQKLLSLASIIGREFSLPAAEALTDIPEDALLDAIDEAVAAGIIREVPAPPGRFAFSHGVVREAIYSRMTAVRRMRIHHRVAQMLERESRRGKASLAELAYHFCQASVYGNAKKAADYAARAGAHAAAGLALEEAARHYEMALRALDSLPGGSEVRAKRFELYDRRSTCYFQVGEWGSAKRESLAALNFLEPQHQEKRCEILVRLAQASFWLLDVPGVRQFAAEAQDLADRAGRDDLWADALAWMASADVAVGDVRSAMASDSRAIERAGGIRSFGLARVPLTLYWAGRTAEAVEYSAQAVVNARSAAAPAFLLYALQHRGLCLSAAGDYDEAIRTFDQARDFGRQCGSLPLLARATSMAVTPQLNLGDLAGAAAVADEARELAHRLAFEPAVVSAGIDLLLISARANDPRRGVSLLPEISRAVDGAAGWHGWKWRMRLEQARTELALAQGKCREAMALAGQVVKQARARSRPKYEALGLAARARAKYGLGLRQAPGDARAAVRVARRLGDPALLLECLDGLLEIDGTAGLLAEARQTVQRILGRLTQQPLRERFLASTAARNNGRMLLIQ